MTRVQRVFGDVMSQLYNPPVLLACWDGKAFSRGAPTSNLQGNRHNCRESTKGVLGKGKATESGSLFTMLLEVCCANI